MPDKNDPAYQYLETLAREYAKTPLGHPRRRVMAREMSLIEALDALLAKKKK